jgi:hypothetical protein
MIEFPCKRCRLHESAAFARWMACSPRAPAAPRSAETTNPVHHLVFGGACRCGSLCGASRNLDFSAFVLTPCSQSFHAKCAGETAQADDKGDWTCKECWELKAQLVAVCASAPGERRVVFLTGCRRTAAARSPPTTLHASRLAAASVTLFPRTRFGRVSVLVLPAVACFKAGRDETAFFSSCSPAPQKSGSRVNGPCSALSSFLAERGILAPSRK